MSSVTQSMLTTPEPIPAPAFQVRSKVRWQQITSSDWGQVMGMRYRWAEHLVCWQWQYYIVLDPDSPSFQWVQSDWAWQNDLEPMPADSAPSIDEEVTDCDQ